MLSAEIIIPGQGWPSSKTYISQDAHLKVRGGDGQGDYSSQLQRREDFPNR